MPQLHVQTLDVGLYLSTRGFVTVMRMKEMLMNIKTMMLVLIKSW